MKKLLYTLLLSLPLIGFTSCSDDDDLPDVNMGIEISGGKFVDGTIYVVRGSDLVIEGITVENNENKPVVVPYVTYYWDFSPIGRVNYGQEPFVINISDVTPLGLHNLEITAPIYAEDKAPAFSVMDYSVQVVETVADVPEGGAYNATKTPTVRSDDSTK